jgi:hypothetical protein
MVGVRIVAWKPSPLTKCSAIAHNSEYNCLNRNPLWMSHRPSQYRAIGMVASETVLPTVLVDHGGSLEDTEHDLQS